MAPLCKGNSPVRGNVCSADKRVAVFAEELSAKLTEGLLKDRRYYVTHTMDSANPKKVLSVLRFSCANL